MKKQVHKHKEHKPRDPTKRLGVRSPPAPRTKAPAPSSSVRSPSGFPFIAPPLPLRLTEQLPAGQSLSQSAAPEALWQQPPRRRPEDLQARFERMSPAERKEAVCEAKENCHHLEQKIGERVEALEGKLGRMTYRLRTDVLARYLSEGKVPAAVEPQLVGILAKAEQAQARIEKLQAQVKGGTPPGGRLEAAATLRALRREQREALCEAQKLIGAQGLTLDLLTTVEQEISPPSRPEESLANMVSSWFQNWALISYFEQQLKLFEQLEEPRRERREAERRDDLEEQRFIKRLELAQLEKRIQIRRAEMSLRR